MTKPTAKSRKEAARDARIAEMRAFGETMWKPTPAPKAMPALNPAVFELDPETARRWEMVKAATR